jgi:DNA mismatch repair protein MutS
VLKSAKSSLLVTLQESIKELTTVTDLLKRAIVESPPLRLSDGGIFREGYNAALDELLALRKNSQEWLTSYQAKLRDETGIKTLKVGYNKMFGYYIEVSRGQTEKMPASFARRQTLTNGERYISPELKEYEEKILSADERIAHIEQELFISLQGQVSAFHEDIFVTAHAIAAIDALRSLAIIAIKHSYCRPTVNTLLFMKGDIPLLKRSILPNSLFPMTSHSTEQKKALCLLLGLIWLESLPISGK